MNRLVNLLLIFIVIVFVLVFGFYIHILLGFSLILLFIGYMFYTFRSNYYAMRGNVYFAKDEIEKALVWYKKAYECKSCPEKHLVGYAYLLLRSGEPEQSEIILLKLLQTSKNREMLVQIQSNLATAYWLQGKKDQGVALLKEVFVEYKNTLVYGNLGYFKILQGNIQEALVFNLEAYTYNPDDNTIMDNLALNYYLLGQMEEAELIFQKLMPKSPKYAEPYYYYSLTLKQLGKTDEAVEQLNLALMKKISFISPITREQIELEAAQV